MRAGNVNKVVMSHEYQKEKDNVLINELNQQADNVKPVILNPGCILESPQELLKIQMSESYLRPINLEALQGGELFFKALQVQSQG